MCVFRTSCACRTDDFEAVSSAIQAGEVFRQVLDNTNAQIRFADLAAKDTRRREDAKQAMDDLKMANYRIDMQRWENFLIDYMTNWFRQLNEEFPGVSMGQLMWEDSEEEWDKAEAAYVAVNPEPECPAPPAESDLCELGVMYDLEERSRQEEQSNDSEFVVFQFSYHQMYRRYGMVLQSSVLDESSMQVLN